MDGHIHSRFAMRALLACAAALACALLVAPTAGAAVKWVVKGRGFGHGVGMSQYGAYGYATHGRDHQFILGHYYQGVSIGQSPAAPVRVLLTIAGGDVSFSKATAACGRVLNPAKSYRAHRNGGGVRLLSSGGSPLANCGDKLRATGSGKVRIAGQGAFRGAFEAVPTSSGGSLNVINAVNVDKYVQGVIAGEMPSSWPLEALKVQAVAARSYALSSQVNGNGFGLYDDTRSQVYNGIAGETARTNRAAKETKQEVIMYGGEIVRAYYSASSGGETENVEYGFIGSDPIPYLKGVEDPFDADAPLPLHSWKLTFSSSAISSRLGVPGKLKEVQITKHGVSPRIVWAKLIGTGGTKKMRGDQIQSALGAYSTWMRFKKVG
ncbi:MAG: SpoIID/LytB domain-containing protein [Actinomycetota bacterium]